MPAEIWVPVASIAVAVIALAGVIYQSREGKRIAREGYVAAEAEVAINGLKALLAAAMEDRNYFRDAMRDCHETLASETRHRRVKK